MQEQYNFSINNVIKKILSKYYQNIKKNFILLNIKQK